jgi:hypothetical protein
MGRRPIGKTAITDAERQQRRRERLRIGGPYLANFLPWDQAPGRRDQSLIPNRALSKFLDELDHWLEYGDVKQVASWLAFHVPDSYRWEQLNALVRAQHHAEKAEAIEWEARRLKEGET